LIICRCDRCKRKLPFPDGYNLKEEDEHYCDRCQGIRAKHFENLYENSELIIENWELKYARLKKKYDKLRTTKKKEICSALEVH